MMAVATAALRAATPSPRTKLPSIFSSEIGNEVRYANEE